MIDSNRLAIAFSIDNGYTNQLRVVLYSLFKYKKPSTVYDIYILAYNLHDDNFVLIDEVVQKFDREKTSRLTYLSISKTDEESLPLFKNVSFGGEWGRETLYRLLLVKYLPEEIQKVLYLDADILIKDDLIELATFNLDGKAVAGVLDFIHFDVYGDLAMHNYRLAKLEGLSDEEYSQCFNKYGYMNAGILLLNIEYWRLHKLDTQMINLLNKIYHEGHNYIPFPVVDFIVEDIDVKWSHEIFPDQDVINYLLLRRNLNEIAYLPINYNLPTYAFSRDVTIRSEQCSARQWLTTLHINMLVEDRTTMKEKIKILHFIGRNKPWLNINHSYADVYRDYANKVGWQIIYEQEELNTKPYLHILKKSIKMLLPHGVVRFIQIIKSR